ncbi:MAG: GNAT family N-acetyltransferase, partial [Chloroflexia bacterium]|nr:GNAT family N-acetyltransferase [Chloroflexia bacterium]
MHVYLETERVVLRRFTEADADLLVELDSDPEVIRFPTGNAPTPRHVIEDEILPDYLRYYARGDRYGFWAAIEKA